MRFILSIVFMFIVDISMAQRAKKQQAEPQHAPNSISPGYEQKNSAPARSTKRSSKGPTYESQEAFEARMIKTVKEKRKAERLMLKPQYSDPSYFGHKRPPKKHKRGKIKFCKECGIRH